MTRKTRNELLARAYTFGKLNAELHDLILELRRPAAIQAKKAWCLTGRKNTKNFDQFALGALFAITVGGIGCIVAKQPAGVPWEALCGVIAVAWLSWIMVSLHLHEMFNTIEFYVTPVAPQDARVGALLASGHADVAAWHERALVERLVLSEFDVIVMSTLRRAATITPEPFNANH